MNKFWIILLACVQFVTFTLHATSVYEWDAERSRYTLSPQEESIGEYVLKQHAQYDYVFEENQFLLYATFHRIVRVNNNEAIQRNNRIYIAMNSVLDLVDLKARSINKSGKVVNFDASNLKELKDDETGQGFRIFAIEGVELGSEIEYFYVLKKHASLYDRVFMQFETPVKNNSFRLSCPTHLKFDFRSYNGFAKIEEGNSTDEYNVYEGAMADIPALRRENFSSFDANRQRIEFKLAYNMAKSEVRLFTWEEAAKTFHGILTTIDKNDAKALDKYVKTMEDKASDNVEERIRNIERKIKTTIQVNPHARDEALDDIESIIKFKVASKEGITRLLYLVFEHVGIKCQPVITCSRDRVRFDEGFDSWAFLDEYVLHFPATDGFISPYSFEFRYPLIPPALTAQKGLFIEPYTYGDINSAIGAVKEIPAADYTINTDNLAMTVTFDEALEGNNISMDREFGGCNATFVAPYYEMVNDSDRGNLIEELVKQTAPDAVIADWNAGATTSGPAENFAMKVDFTSRHFIETAGPRILFKVGELIGPQVEMYRDDQRMSGVENDFNRGYDREIRLRIPQGYQVRNPDDVKINVVYRDDDKQPYLFVSEYAMEGNEMVINIKEYYKEIFAPVSRYEEFRSVINAAADFNKVILVLEKKR